MKKIFYMLLIGTFVLSACNDAEHPVELLNCSAALPPSFKFDDLKLKAMTSLINKKSGTMSVLYANQLGLENSIKGAKAHVAGEVISLITWKQKDDDHWFGAKIPGNLQLAELVETVAAPTGLITIYQRYIGKNLLADTDTARRQERIKYIIYQQPSVMP